MNESTDWTAPLPGHWRRDFRLAEWCPGPVSHSCETWLLPALDRGFSDSSLDEYGSGTKTGVVTVNGWCFTTNPMPTRPLGMLTRSPVRMIGIAGAMARMFARPDVLERRVASPGLERYRTIDLPALRAAIADADRAVGDATITELVGLVDTLAVGTGRLMLGMVQAMGFASKVEFALASFLAEHPMPGVKVTALDLASGHVAPVPTQPHAVVSLDWCEPTAGERGTVHVPDDAIRLLQIERRTKAEAECRAALAGDPKATARLDLLLALLARWIPVREDMAAEFTLAWPTMRRALRQIGTELVEGGRIRSVDDVFELSRAEIEAAVSDPTPLHDLAEERRALRHARRTLTPPLSLGKPIGPWKKADRIFATLRTSPPAGARVIVTGLGASAGTATGTARVVLGPDDFDALLPGEILVAPATAPAWTPLFALAAGVVTDGGGPFAHTSVVAREYGIPAIVTATGATARIRTGDHIAIDAASGTVTAGPGR